MKKYLAYCAVALLFVACNQGNKSHREPTSDAVDSLAEIADSSSSEKIIKTADMRFRVKNVQQTKVKLGELIKAEGGTLAEFSIHSDVYQSEKVRYSTDSLLELTSYRTEGSIVAKVPADKLDEFTNRVAGMAVFVDQQSMKFDDQSIAYLSNQLKNQNRVEAVKQLNKNANKKSNNVETALELKDDYVDQKIQNMRINERVKYSDITLSFYQDNTVKKLVVGNDNLSDYRPSFFRRLGLNIQNGWVIFMEFLLLLANLWMLILLVIAGFFAFSVYRKRRNAKA
ncbi:DUF4349 domain-containing protein [Pedobacter gandavensis]|uniref:DUF4349 domain-containing protein n=1 Tax=Pedobacter gandavensis TaxID=2679963 RepID=A0ABR6F0Z2_9SPHI|nr:DUF4349 domain-containing protein [Pedobacter gandavensis]MBB2151177.1 DUF4349 domain-containing protein [Pedobacter gandavensis]